MRQAANRDRDKETEGGEMRQKKEDIKCMPSRERQTDTSPSTGTDLHSYRRIHRGILCTEFQEEKTTARVSRQTWIKYHFQWRHRDVARQRRILRRCFCNEQMAHR